MHFRIVRVIGVIFCMSLNVVSMYAALNDGDTTLSCKQQNDLDELLEDCCRAGDTDGVLQLLAQGANANARATPLVAASLQGHREIVKVLLEQGADANQCRNNGNGWSALSRAILKRHIEIVSMLIDAGARPTPDDISNVIESNNLDLARPVFEKHKNLLNIQLRYAQTPFSMAFKKGFFDMVELLLQNGASCKGQVASMIPDIDSRVSSDTEKVVASGMKLVLKMRRNEVMPELARELLQAVRTPNGRKALWLTELGVSADVIDGVGYTAFDHAILTNKIEVAECMLAKGAFLNANLICALARKEYGGIFATVSEQMKWFLNQNIVVDARDPRGSGETALMIAVRNGHVPLMKLLLEKGADVLAADHEGNTPMSMLTTSHMLEGHHKRAVQALFVQALSASTIAKQRQAAATWYQGVSQMDRAIRDMDGRLLKKKQDSVSGQKQETEKIEFEEEEEKQIAAGMTFTEMHANIQDYKNEIVSKFGKAVFEDEYAKECIERERDEIARGNFVCYRAQPEVLKVLEYFREETYRLMELYTGEYKNYVHSRFWKYASTEKTIYEYQQKVGTFGQKDNHLAANIALWGNVKNGGSCSWGYFGSNAKEDEVKLEALLTEMFDAYRFEKSFIPLLLRLREQDRFNAATLQQIVVPGDLVDKLVMLAEVGPCNPYRNKIAVEGMTDEELGWDNHLCCYTKLTPLLEACKQGKVAFDDSWQVRLLLDKEHGLNPKSKKRVKFYEYRRVSKEIIDAFKNKAKRVAHQVFAEWLERQLREDGIPASVTGDRIAEFFELAGKKASVEERPNEQEWRKRLSPASPQDDVADVATVIAAHAAAAAAVGEPCDVPCDVKTFWQHTAVGKATAREARVRMVFPEKNRKQYHKTSGVWDLHADAQGCGVITDGDAMKQVFVNNCVQNQAQNDRIPTRYDGDGRVRVVTYNVHQWTDAFGKDSTNDILAALQKIEADIVVLQEAAGFDDAQVMPRLMEMGYLYHTQSHTNMIVSRYPFVGEPMACVYAVDQKGEPRTVINVKVQLPDGGELSVYGTHLDVWDQTGHKRVEEVNELMKLVAQDPCKNIILAGDWNENRERDYQYQVADSVCGRKVLAWDLLTQNFNARTSKAAIPTGALTLIEKCGFSDSFDVAACRVHSADAGVGAKQPQGRVLTQPTFTTWTGTWIDHIWCGHGVNVEGSWIWYDPASDHLPVIADIKVKG